jgi:protein tyrosine phosphatase
MEHRLLQRLACNKLQYDSLYKDQNMNLQAKNRYKEVLPYSYNRVVLPTESQLDDALFNHYINASYMNVS